MWIVILLEMHVGVMLSMLNIKIKQLSNLGNRFLNFV